MLDFMAFMFCKQCSVDRGFTDYDCDRFATRTYILLRKSISKKPCFTFRYEEVKTCSESLAKVAVWSDCDRQK